jgi:ATP-binding cassette subfamily F protein 3
MIQFNQVSYFLPQGFLFENVKIQLNKGDKIGLVGKNGAGKSTLLKLVSKELHPSEGEIIIPKQTSIGYLKQEITFKTEQSIFNYLNDSNPKFNNINLRLNEINEELTTREDYESVTYLSLLDELNDLNQEFDLLEGFKWKEKIETTLKGLGFNDNDFHKQVKELSGGWKMRLELARILINNPDILLLDEPTNHLDIVSISWLERFLIKFDGIVIIISHDRLFLDAITKRTLEISLRKVFDFPFPYTLYTKKRAEENLIKENEKKQQEKEIKQTERLISKFRAKSSKAAFAQSLIKKLEKTEIIEVENNLEGSIKINFPLSVNPGKQVLEIEDLSKSYGEKKILNAISIAVGRGEKIALLGANGIGKSTLLKCITNKIEFSGSIKHGHNVNVTYFAQDQADQLDKTKTVYETVDHVAEGEIRKKLRSILGSFLFTADDIDKKVSALSGGEKTRLALCQLLLSPSNFLILDEPTNHLDILSKNVLKEALKNYEGTFIVVSHDRDFLDGLTNRIWDIANKQIRVHHFDLAEYLSLINNDAQAPNKEVKKDNIKKKKKITPNKLTQKIEKEIKKIEVKVSSIEDKIKDLEHKISVAHLDMNNNVSEVYQEIEVQNNELEKLLSDWETKSVELERLK